MHDDWIGCKAQSTACSNRTTLCLKRGGTRTTEARAVHARAFDEVLRGARRRSEGVESDDACRHPALTRSRANPQFNETTLRLRLASKGIAYVVMPDLGGRRGKSKTADPSRNAGWRVAAFKNYADTPELPVCSIAVTTPRVDVRHHVRRRRLVALPPSDRRRLRDHTSRGGAPHLYRDEGGLGDANTVCTCRSTTPHAALSRVTERSAVASAHAGFVRAIVSDVS